MLVTVRTWRGDQEIELSEALTPKVSNDRGGVAEQAQDQADANARAIGLLAALLVERRLISVEEAASACGAYSIIKTEES